MSTLGIFYSSFYFFLSLKFSIIYFLKYKNSSGFSLNQERRNKMLYKEERVPSNRRVTEIISGYITILPKAGFKTGVKAVCSPCSMRKLWKQLHTLLSISQRQWLCTFHTWWWWWWWWWDDDGLMMNRTTTWESKVMGYHSVTGVSLLFLMCYKNNS